MGIIALLQKSVPEQLAQFVPGVPASSREQWEALNPAMCHAIVAEAEKQVTQEVQPLPMSLYRDFCKTGNRVAFETVYFNRRVILNILTLAECIESKGRFIDAIIDYVFAICEESAWQLPAHNTYVRDTPQHPIPDVDRPILDLFACETGAQLAMVYFLLYEQLQAVHPTVTARIQSELQKRIFTPYLDTHFWWMGYEKQPTNNWTVWCTQNVLIASAIVQDTLQPKQMHKIIKRAMYSLDRFLSEYGEDGCCDEGPQYYRHAGVCLGMALNILDQITSGIFGGVILESKLTNIAEYIVNIHAQGPYYFNFADSAAKAGNAGIGEYEFGCLINSPLLRHFAAIDWYHEVWPHWQLVPTGTNEGINLYYLTLELFAASSLMQDACGDKKIIVDADHAYKSVGIYISRDDHYSLAMKAGDNNDSHNHNDTGSFILYKDGKPFIIDVGVETYTKKTFSPDRYDIWTMQSLYHNVTNIEGTQQQAGADYAASNVRYHATPERTTLSMQLAHAYPKESTLDAYERHYEFIKHKCLRVTDTVRLSSPKKSVFTLMTCYKPEVHDNEIVLPAVGKIQLATSSATPCAITVEPIAITDQRLLQSWPNTLYRILITYSQTITATFE